MTQKSLTFNECKQLSSRIIAMNPNRRANMGQISSHLLDDKGKYVPCIIVIDTVMRQLIQSVFPQIIDIFGLQRHFLVVFYRMEIAVYQHLSLLQVALIKDILMGD